MLDKTALLQTMVWRPISGRPVLKPLHPMRYHAVVIQKLTFVGLTLHQNDQNDRCAYLYKTNWVYPDTCPCHNNLAPSIQNNLTCTTDVWCDLSAIRIVFNRSRIIKSHTHINIHKHCEKTAQLCSNTLGPHNRGWLATYQLHEKKCIHSWFQIRSYLRYIPNNHIYTRHPLTNESTPNNMGKYIVCNQPYEQWYDYNKTKTVCDTITVAWSERAAQLAAGGVASVWRSWVRSPRGLR